MDWNEYQLKALRTQANQEAILNRLVELGPLVMQLDNGTRGLTDEVGEINSAVKKHIEYGQPLDVNNLKEEVGDCLWRLAQICSAVGITLQACAEANIKKLLVRYPDKYSDHQAAEENRDRKTEAQALSIPIQPASEVVAQMEARVWKWGRPDISGDIEYLYAGEVGKALTAAPCDVVGSIWRNYDVQDNNWGTDTWWRPYRMRVQKSPETMEAQGWKWGAPDVCGDIEYLYSWQAKEGKPLPDPYLFPDYTPDVDWGDETWWRLKASTEIKPSPTSESIYQNGNGFGEPPEEEEEVVSSSDNSYTKRCHKCGRPVHKTSQTNPPCCADCYKP